MNGNHVFKQKSVAKVCKYLIFRILSTVDAKINAVLTMFFVVSTAFAQGPFPPAAGQPGSTAIFKDSAIIKSWATGIELYRGWVNISDTTVYYNGSNKASFGYPAIALGQAQESSFDVVSLGDGGNATLTFDRVIVNGPGPDFAIFENSFSDNFLELAFVEVSSDGKRFVRFPAVSLTQTNTQIGGFGTLDPTNIHNLAGKYRQGYGTPFDLQDLIDSSGIDLNNIRFVRVIDVVGSINDLYCSYDAFGHKVNDPFPTPFHSCGFDLDAVAVINFGQVFTISNFNDLPLNADSYWNGSDLSGGFVSNTVFYQNVYDANYSSWYGFAYSNMRDNTTPGYTNQYSAITRGGMDATVEGGTNYAIGYVPIDWHNNYDLISIEVTFQKPSIVSGFYYTNSTYAYLSMKYGDSFAKKFGGATGNDPDFFKLLVWGVKTDNSLTDTLEFYLADYRFSDNINDYIVDNWRWADLFSLGKVKKLKFSLLSSDIGEFGMNTPAYFCMDNLTFYEAPNILNLTEPVEDYDLKISVFPNPFDNFLKVNSETNFSLIIYDVYGSKVAEYYDIENDLTITTTKFPEGIYFVVIVNNSNRKVFKLIKK